MWATNGLLTRVAMESMDYYADLHAHLLGCTLSAGFDYASVSRHYWGDKIHDERSMCLSRLQAALRSYTVLRNGSKSDWQTFNLMHKRNLSMVQEVKTPAKPYKACSKCASFMHPPGLDNCPWKNRGDKAARKAAKEALAKMGGATGDEDDTEE